MVNAIHRSTGTTFRKARKAAVEQAAGAPMSGELKSPTLGSQLEPLFGAWINQDHRSSEVSIVVVARHGAPGHVQFAAFFVEDGLGLVECFGNSSCPESSFLRLVRAPHLLGTAAPFAPCELLVAQELVLGGAELARKSGIALPREFASMVWIVGELPPGDVLPRELFPTGEDMLTLGIFEGDKGRPTVADRIALIGDPIDRLRQVARTSGSAFTPVFDRPGPEYGVEPPADGCGTELPPGMEPMVLTSVHFEHGDPEDALLRLRGLLDLEIERSQPDCSRFAWVRKYPAGHWNVSPADADARQVLGHVTVTSKEVVAEVKTRAWGEVVRRMMVAAGGGCLRYHGTQYRDPVPEIVEAVKTR
ncbi:MAG: hypothetical protein HYZ53_29425 [Planctomycetes bacterium]|nr:hypothetical protein [Planctomycetota bacterium]